jgi:hypothetical protein
MLRGRYHDGGGNQCDEWRWLTVHVWGVLGYLSVRLGRAIRGTRARLAYRKHINSEYSVL